MCIRAYILPISQPHSSTQQYAEPHIVMDRHAAHDQADTEMEDSTVDFPTHGRVLNSSDKGVDQSHLTSSPSSDSTGPSPSGETGFLINLCKLLDDKDLQDCAQWAEVHGFRILELPKFRKVALPKYYAHPQWGNFLRQLSHYGIHKKNDFCWHWDNKLYRGCQLRQVTKPLKAASLGQSQTHPQSASTLSSSSYQPSEVMELRVKVNVLEIKIAALEEIVVEMYGHWLLHSSSPTPPMMGSFAMDGTGPTSPLQRDNGGYNHQAPNYGVQATQTPVDRNSSQAESGYDHQSTVNHPHEGGPPTLANPFPHISANLDPDSSSNFAEDPTNMAAYSSPTSSSSNAHNPLHQAMQVTQTGGPVAPQYYPSQSQHPPSGTTSNLTGSSGGAQSTFTGGGPSSCNSDPPAYPLPSAPPQNIEHVSFSSLPSQHPLTSGTSHLPGSSTGDQIVFTGIQEHPSSPLQFTDFSGFEHLLEDDNLVGSAGRAALRTTRLIKKTGAVPKWFPKQFISRAETWVVEESEVDPEGRVVMEDVVLREAEDGWVGSLFFVFVGPGGRKLLLAPDAVVVPSFLATPDGGSGRRRRERTARRGKEWSPTRVTANVVSNFGWGLTKKIEKYGVTKFKANLERSRQGISLVLQAVREHRMRLQGLQPLALGLGADGYPSHSQSTSSSQIPQHQLWKDSRLEEDESGSSSAGYDSRRTYHASPSSSSSSSTYSSDASPPSLSPAASTLRSRSWMPQWLSSRMPFAKREAGVGASASVVAPLPSPPPASSPSSIGSVSLSQDHDSARDAPSPPSSSSSL
ncbi:hypothetical protein FRB90_009415 [Tulasnella sp. 427]|nr:hypothetical protein FRB90_009415 [Tulasnella sp. 427]